MAPRRPPTPARLGPDGARLWRALHAVFSFEPHETEVLAEACRALDEVRRLDELLAVQGVEVAGSRGQVRVHPAVSEVRQHRAAFTRLLSALQLEGAEVASPESVRATRAATVRWNREKEKRGHG